MEDGMPIGLWSANGCAISQRVVSRLGRERMRFRLQREDDALRRVVPGYLSPFA